MAEKNDSEIVVHLPTSRQRLFRQFAERQGLSSSELGRQLVQQYLDQQRAEFEYMRTVFDADG
jgi:hypothetical protein